MATRGRFNVYGSVGLSLSRGRVTHLCTSILSHCVLSSDRPSEKFVYSEKLKSFERFSPFFLYSRIGVSWIRDNRTGWNYDGTARWRVTSSGMNYWSMVSYNNKNSSLVRRYKNECIYTSWIFNENTFFSEMKIFLENSFIINKRFLYQVFE